MQANPTGGQVVSGTATITTVPGTVTISQATSTASINWHDFSIASGELTRFQVPTSTSATLNRVTGGNISAIYGTLQSNGQLYLINPNGIVVGPTGKIDTAGFLASTLNFSDTQFNQQGDLTLTGSSTAGVSNEGTIHAAMGDVYLVAAQVSNSGTITAPKGTVGLAAGNQVLVQKAGDQHLFVQVNSTAKTQATGVSNSGSIRAAAAELKAAGGNAYALAINNTGNIAATGIKTINGQVYLTADGADITNSGTISAKQANGNGGMIVVNAHSVTAPTKGTLLNSGTIAATGTAAGTTGGTVELLGDRVGVTDQGSVDVSGDAGGGTALIGGDEHGANAAIPDADQTYLGPDATITADALTLGLGGKVILWGNETNQVYGQISATGGAQGGNGGFVETSAAQLQVLTAPNLSAPKGQGGTWLLDPSDVTISDTAANSGYVGAPGGPAGINPFGLNTTNGIVTISQATLQAALAGDVDVSIDASSGSGASDSGSITWTQPGGTAFDISNINGSNLYFNAPNQLTLSGVTIKSISGGGSLTLTMNQTVTGTVTVTGANINLNSGYFYAEGSSVSLGGTITAAGISAYSPQINLTDATLTTAAAGSNYPFFSLVNSSAGQVNITDSTLNITGSYSFIGSDTGTVSQVAIAGSTITQTQGAGEEIYIEGASEMAGAPGVSITASSSITTDAGSIFIKGEGLVAAGSDATGVLISASTLTCGSAGAPGTGHITIEGSSDSGSTSLTPNSVFANNSYGVQILGSTISSYSTAQMKIEGLAYAANNVDSVGVDLNSSESDTLIESFNGEARIKGSVESESFSGSPGEANVVAGVRTASTEIEANGATADISISADTHDATASDNGDTSVQARNVGVYFQGYTTISAAGSNVLLSTPIAIGGRAGPAVSSTGNTLETESDGVWLSGASGEAVTVTNTGLGATVLYGEAGSATGAMVADLGVTLGTSAQSPVSVTSPDGGSIGIAGLGGSVSAGANTSFSGLAEGVFMEYSTVTATTGDIVILAAGATTSGSLPSGSTLTIAGLGFASTTLQTNTTTAGANPIPNGGSVPPLILIYATDSAAVTNASGKASFQLGSATNYAVDESTSSSVITGNLVMGNFYDLFSAYGPAATVAAAPTFAQFNSYITGTAASTISSEGITFNPAGIVSLTSTTNQITNLDSALDGSGGFNLYDSVSLTVDPIGGSDNLNYGQVDVAGDGPVSITVAPDMNLTLTDISPLTGKASAAPVIGSVIATAGSGNTITLTTSGTGELINTAGASALSVAGGASYIIYAASPANVTLDGIGSTQTLYNTLSPGAAGSTVNTIAYASMAPVTGLDSLSGTAYTDSGVTISGNTTIDLVFDGSLLGTTTTSGTGAFSFNISAADLNSGVVLTGPADNGNTFYQANNPAATITGVDIWGSTLRVMADTASNFALGQVAASLAGAGINYTVNGSNLSTNAGVNLLILPNSAYTLDGDMIAGGALTTGANSALSSSGTGTITLTGTSIALGGSLTSAGTVNFATANAGAPTQGAITDSGALQVGSFILESGSWSQVVGQGGLTALPAFSATSDFELHGSSTFLRAAGVDAANGNAYELADVYGLQGLGSPSGTLLTANAELTNNIDASGTATWNPTGSTPAYAGFEPIGSSSGESSGQFTGTFNGLGHTIDGLTIDRPNALVVGLFGASVGTIENVGLTNVQVNGLADVGALVGAVANPSGMIINAFSTGAVIAGDSGSNTGGLVGLNEGTISNSSSSAAVTFGNSDDGGVGGLVGENDGVVEESYATGPVTAGGSFDIGGLVGLNSGTVQMSYSSGQVTAGSGSNGVGGLIGSDTADIGTIPSVSSSFSISPVNVGAGSSNVGGLIGINANAGVTIINTYSAGPVMAGAGSTDVGALVGNNLGTIANSFWDMDTAGSAIVSGVGSDTTPNTTPGVTAATTDDLQSESYILAHSPTTPTFDFSNTWTTYGGKYTPQLIGLPIAGTVPSSPAGTNLLAVDPSKEVNDALFSIVPIQQLEGILDPNIVGGAGGVAGHDDHGSDRALENRLAAKYGRPHAEELMAVVEEDRKDGSTVNTGTLATKWAANTGLSKLLRMGETAALSQGLTQSQFNNPLIFDLFQQQDTPSLQNELSQAAAGKGGHGH